ncbi:MAG: hypothetical protein ACRDRN_27775 [Sciscionella sp.]
MTTSPTPPHVGPWIQRWLSAPRYAVYLAAATGETERALALYEWNSQLSAALLRDLAHLEVGLRNAYDEAFSTSWPGALHWTGVGDEVFAPLHRSRNGRRIDVNRKPRDTLQRALRAAGGKGAPPGKVIAELPFGFWRYLSSAAHEKTLWVPCLHRAFPPGIDRRDIDRPAGRLHQLRNRVAHHEPLLRTKVATHLEDLCWLATHIDPELGKYLTATTTVPHWLTRQP